MEEGEGKGKGGGAGAKLAELFLKYYEVATKASLSADKFQQALKQYSYTQTEKEADLKSFDATVSTVGLEIKEARENFLLFKGLSYNTEFQGPRANQLFTQISMGTNDMALSSDQSRDVFKAAGELMHTGVLNKENLKSFVEAYPKAKEDLALSLGMSYDRLEKAADKGSLSATQVLESYGKYQQLVHGQPLNLQSTQASYNRLFSNFEGFNARMGDALDINSAISGVVGWAGEKVAGVNTYIDRNKFIHKSLEHAHASRLDIEAYDGSFGDKEVEIKGIADMVQRSMARSVTNRATSKHEYEYLKGLKWVWQKHYDEYQKQWKDHPEVLKNHPELRSRFNNIFAVIDYGMSSIEDVQDRQIAENAKRRALTGTQISTTPLDGRSKDITLAAQANGKKDVGSSAAGNKMKQAAASAAQKQGQAHATGAVSKAAPAEAKHGAEPKAKDPCDCGCNTTINIGRLADITLQTNNVIEGGDQIKDIITKVLLEVLNDANQGCD